jgi:hypothetical protein
MKTRVLFTAIAIVGSVLSMSASPGYGDDPPPPQLVSQWTFTAGSLNASVGTNHLSAVGAVALGDYNGGILNLSGGYATRSTSVPNTISNLPAGADARSVMAWIRPAPEALDPDGGTVVGWGDGLKAGQEFMLQRMKASDDNWYLFTDGLNGDNNIVIDAADLPPFDQWSHVALTFDGAAWKYYLNGELVDEGEFEVPISTPVISDPATEDWVAIGVRGDPTDPAQTSYQGSVDDVRIYTGAVSQANIRALFDLTAPSVSALSLGLSKVDGNYVVGIGEEIQLNATISDSVSWIKGAEYRLYRRTGTGPDEVTSGWTPMVPLNDLNSSSEMFKAMFDVESIDGTYVACVRGADDAYAFNNVSPRSCVEFKAYDQYAKIEGNFKVGKHPVRTYSGWVARSGEEVLGSITVNYKNLGTACTFRPGAREAGDWSLVNDDHLALGNWDRRCSNGTELLSDNDFYLFDNAAWPSNGAIRMDEAESASTTYDIGLGIDFLPESGDEPEALTNGYIQIVDLN